jgi:hypothetical protein
MLRFQLAKDKAVVLSFVEIYCALSFLDAFTTSKSSTFATNNFGDHWGRLIGGQQRHSTIAVGGFAFDRVGNPG